MLRLKKKNKGVGEMLKQCQYKTNPVGYYLLKNCPSLSLHFLYCTLYFEGVIEEARHPSLAKP